MLHRSLAEPGLHRATLSSCLVSQQSKREFIYLAVIALKFFVLFSEAGCAVQIHTTISPLLSFDATLGLHFKWERQLWSELMCL